MILSRGKTDSASSRQAVSASKAKQITPSLEDFIIKRDYTGARAFLELSAENANDEKKLLMQQCSAFCSFHLGDYQRALQQYTDVREVLAEDVQVKLNICVCMFYLGLYEDAEQLIGQTTDSKLKLRLQFHLANVFNKDEQVLELAEELKNSNVEDQLTVASMHYLRAHYQEAIDIYKRILLDNKEFIAVNVYLALCFYKLDYYDMSQEVLDIYLAKYPDSTIAINLKACNRFRLFNGRVAEQEIKHILDNTGTFGTDLIRHNMVVFRNGEGALQVFPALLNIIPEARLNLAIYYLKNGDVQEAHTLIKEMQPTVPHEYVLKGVVHAAMGQQQRSTEHIKTAQQNLHLVGSSATECDTIPGRQSMASAFFLYGQFEEVLVYMNSIRSYFINDDTFNYNYAQAKCATGYYKEAEELLLQISDLNLKNQHAYCMVLSKCHIHAGHAEKAWNIFITRDTNSEAFLLLQLIANECYKCQEFWVAAKAFDMLEKLDPSPEYWEGKRGACAGVLYALHTQADRGRSPNGVSDIIGLLRESTNSQADTIIKTIRKHLTSFK